MSASVSSDLEIRRVASVRTGGILQAVLTVCRIVVPTGRGEGGCSTITTPDCVEMDSVGAGGQVGRGDIDVYDSTCFLP